MAQNTVRRSTTTMGDKKCLKNTTKYSFRVQSAPPLSLQQYLRSSTGTRPGAANWKHSGKYREPTFRAYLSPAVKEKPKPVERRWIPPSPYKHERPTSLSPEKKVEERIKEPLWHPPGPYKDKRPTSISPEKRPQESIPKPVWRPAGKFEHKPVPYFDPPNLRWSLQELSRSMPEMRPKTFRSSSSMSRLRQSEAVEET
ncbi:unnamed protein product [Adineta steineri]|uniref:Uncharacterized protein n=1 Tax=Adineta steineri TaxID=433720 RepID=A0A814BUB8_9BILA|nr:unnamed protein product [Adineta steineri]CAF0949402.1 unnamed protein product [Adineta steineri]CAF3921725.1 unnamed protein product [Adineta steineri]CAF3933341.1 unnamed protein product [Adineta steineri]